MKRDRVIQFIVWIICWLEELKVEINDRRFKYAVLRAQQNIIKERCLREKAHTAYLARAINI